MRRIEKRRYGVTLSVLGAAAALFLSGCAGTSGPGSGGSSGSSMSVSVAEPAAGATVTPPFTVKVNSSVPLGPTSSGLHHVHVWFDDNQADYVVVESNSTQVMTLAPGPHTLHVSLRNADHSAAGAETQVQITAGGSGAPSSGPATTPGTETTSPY